jgi:hypothetical protein
MSLPLLCNSTDDEICGRDMELIELHKKIQPVGNRQPLGFALRRNNNQTALPLLGCHSEFSPGLKTLTGW